MMLSAIADMEDYGNQEAYILEDLNFNLLDKSKYILDTKYSKVMVPLAKKYSLFCCIHNSLGPLPEWLRQIQLY